MSYAKILIKGTIEVQTGLHIGGSGGYSAIGAVDSTVIRDSISGNPIIPGSSLKGKMRYLLQKTFRASKSPSDDDIKVIRLFGSSGESNTRIVSSRLKFSDCFMNEESLKELKNAYIRTTEIKSENTIDRLTSKATPRQIERVVRGARFDFELIYDVLEGFENEVEEDFKNISTAIKLLENDYLGGNGSRGSGRILFTDLQTKTIFGEAPKVKLEV